jgi:esterase
VTLLTHATLGEGEKTVVFLHGILGSGANWRTFAKRLVADKPAWRAVLVDLRKHGGSQDFSRPHTIAACANDVVELEKALGARFDAVIGHSFGGKVALELVQMRPATEMAWVLDTAPGSRPDRRDPAQKREPRTSEQVVALLSTLPEKFDTREAFIAYVEGHGLERSIAMWLAMNVRAAESGGYSLRVDVAAMRELLDDFFMRDAWAIFEDPARTAKLHLVVGGKSDALDNAERAVANRVAQSWPDRTWVHVLANAGHWVHVDAPDELFTLVAQYF